MQESEIDVLSPEFQTRLLFYSLNRGDIEGVKKALVAGANVNGRSHGDNTPLLFAADRASLNIMRLLLEKGADVNASDVRGDTALMRAAFGGKLDVARLLLIHGADPEMKDREGKMAHELADMAAEFLFQENAVETAHLLKDALEIHRRQKNQEKAHQIAQQRQSALNKRKPRPVIKF